MQFHGKMSKCEINTFVFFDIETTGLPEYEAKTKITEMALVACSKEHLLSSSMKDLPRVIHKLVLVLNPMKPMLPAISKITGLDNYLLEKLRKFDKNTFELLTNYLNQLHEPICIVAHNGDRFDFPILQKHLMRLSLSLPNEILCVDSLKIFRKIDESKDTQSSPFEEFLRTDNSAIQQKNETTPSRHSERFSKNTRSPYPRLNSCRQLSFNVSSTTNQSNEHVDTSIGGIQPKISSAKLTKTSTSYKLADIFQRLYERKPGVTHNAEADTILLLQCAIATRDKFIDLAEKDSIKLSDIKPL